MGGASGFENRYDADSIIPRVLKHSTFGYLGKNSTPLEQIVVSIRLIV
jgi:hypothetical protein